MKRGPSCFIEFHTIRPISGGYVDAEIHAKALRNSLYHQQPIRVGRESSKRTAIHPGECFVIRFSYLFTWSNPWSIKIKVSIVFKYCNYKIRETRGKQRNVVNRSNNFSKRSAVSDVICVTIRARFERSRDSKKTKSAFGEEKEN